MPERDWIGGRNQRIFSTAGREQCMTAMVIALNVHRCGEGGSRISSAAGGFAIGRSDHIADGRYVCFLVLKPLQCQRLFLTIASHPQFKKRRYRTEQLAIAK